tara:strand:+ start:5877 stop:6197 length:321 start_codon:yes stop_codon:yes gene_type:complete
MKSEKKPAKKPPLEKTIVGNVISQAKRMGWLPINMHGNQFSLKGLPDVLVVKDGTAAWMEVKRPGHHPTRIQEHRMRQLSDFGCRVTVVFSAADARHFLESVDPRN